MKKNIITLTSDDGDVDVEVLEQLVYDNITYLLCADAEDEESDCYILKQISDDVSEEVAYEILDDSATDKIFDMFAEKLKDEIIIKR